MTSKRTHQLRLYAGVAVVALVIALVAAQCVSRPDPPAETGPFRRSPVAIGAVAGSADAFVDSIGVNTHLRYSDTSYGEFPLVKQRLLELGIRHIRDEVTRDTPDVYARLNDLSRSGIRSTLVMGRPEYGGKKNPYGSLDQLYQVFVDELLDTAVAVEGPNEMDLSDVGGWASKTSSYQKRLYARMSKSGSTRDLLVLAPSIGRYEDRSRYIQMGNLVSATDIGNLHLYPGGVMLTTDRLNESLEHGALVAGNAAVHITETGYHQSPSATDQPEGHPATTPAEAGVLMPRILAEAFRGGVDRTFIYELVDQYNDPRTAESNFGLLTWDFRPKPAFTSVKNLLSIVSDRTARGAPAGAPAPGLDIRTSSGDVRTLVLQKADGTLLLLVWREVPPSPTLACADSSPAGSVAVTVAAASGFCVARTYRPSCSAEPLREAAVTGELTVSATADITVIELVRQP